MNTLCETGDRYHMQYRFINPLESDHNDLVEAIFTLKLMPDRRPFAKIHFEIFTVEMAFC